jgi:fucose 4-O-acetylase-like acetyltransferase
LFVGVSNILYLSQSPLDQKDFLFRSLVAHALLVFLFALNEKIRKELFVISITNSRTKKQLMRVFNQIAPSAIVSRDGAIVMCNEKFEKLVTEQIGAKSFPSNFLKMIQNDEQAKNQMSDAIHNTISKG